MTTVRGRGMCSSIGWRFVSESTLIRSKDFLPIFRQLSRFSEDSSHYQRFHNILNVMKRWTYTFRINKSKNLLTSPQKYCIIKSNRLDASLGEESWLSMVGCYSWQFFCRLLVLPPSQCVSFCLLECKCFLLYRACYLGMACQGARYVCCCGYMPFLLCWVWLKW